MRPKPFLGGWEGWKKSCEWSMPIINRINNHLTQGSKSLYLRRISLELKVNWSQDLKMIRMVLGSSVS